MKKLSLILTMVLLIAGFAVAQRTITGTVADAKGGFMDNIVKKKLTNFIMKVLLL